MAVWVDVLGLIMLACLGPGNATPLDDYVNRPDPSYEYKLLSKVQGVTHTLYILNMTSQIWKANLTDQSVWWHYLVITIPDKITRDSAFMLLSGGSNHDGQPSQTDEFIRYTTTIAVATRSVAACLKQVPNQPIVFNDDPSKKSRSEDAIIAWTWKTFVDNNASDPEILLRMPMTKASVRGMDTIQDFVKKETGVRINRFLVSGASKRGWTTWTTAAVDKRVVALAPMVEDLLNMVSNLHHFYRSLGGWTNQFEDYYALNFTAELDNPAVKLMANIIDPLSYKDRYKNKPILIISTGGDEFFMIDDARFYYKDLVGPTYLRMLPNTEHSLDGHETTIFFSIRAFYLSVMDGVPLPKLKWKMAWTSKGGRITLQTDTAPKTVNVFHTTTLDGKRKDFRSLRGTPGNILEPQVHPVVWLQKDAIPKGNNTWIAECDNPSKGWTAFFIQVTFQGVEDSVLYFTTQTLVTPDTYPFPDCHGQSCLGVLV